MDVFLGTLQTVLLFAFNLFMLCLAFRNRIKRQGIGFSLVIAAGMSAAAISGYYLYVYEIARIWQYVYIVLYFLLTMALCGLLFRCRLRECVFLYFVIQTYVDDTFMMAKIFQFYVLGGITDNALFFYPAQIAAVLIGSPLIYHFANLKLQKLVDTTESMRFWRYIWMMPLSFYIVYRIGISNRYVRLESVWSEANIMVPLFWTIATILAYFMVVNTLLEVVKHVEDREKLDAAERQLHMQKEQYQKLSESIEETRRMRHDLSHQMRVIAGYVSRGELEKLREYIRSYLEQMEMEELPLCENHAIDSMVQYYMRAAERENIQMEVKLETLRDLPCSEIDVCVVLGNLLENALEACRRQNGGKRHIDLKLNTGRQNFIAIQTANSCDADILRKAGVFLSAKRNYSAPGIGIASVKRIAERYQGTAEFTYSGGEFLAKVFLNQNQEG